MATVLWYLSDVEAGGEFVFPRMDHAPPVANKKACQMGLRVKPEKGMVIVLYSLKPDGSVDPLSVHDQMGSQQMGAELISLDESTCGLRAVYSSLEFDRPSFGLT